MFGLRIVPGCGMLRNREEACGVPRKNTRNTKGRIISAAWKLFYEQGYEETTVEDIVFESETSKGSFYHYFGGKDALLGTLSDLFDEKYESLQETMDPNMPALEQLLFLNSELFRLIENSVSLDLLARLLSPPLVTSGGKPLLNHKRTYYRLLRRIIAQGQERGEIAKHRSVSDLVKRYTLCERALLYDWCLCGGEYSLVACTDQMTPMFLRSYLPEDGKSAQEVPKSIPKNRPAEND